MNFYERLILNLQGQQLIACFANTESYLNHVLRQNSVP